jgi:hypothetical protein
VVVTGGSGWFFISLRARTQQPDWSRPPWRKATAFLVWYKPSGHRGDWASLIAGDATCRLLRCDAAHALFENQGSGWTSKQPRFRESRRNPAAGVLSAFHSPGQTVLSPK